LRHHVWPHRSRACPRRLPEHVDLFGRLSEFATKFTAP